MGRFIFTAAVLVAGTFLFTAESPAGGDPLPGYALFNGDTNGDGGLDLSDAVYLLGHLYTGGPGPVPIACGVTAASIANGDSNGDGQLDLSDGIHLLAHLFLGGVAPAPCDELGLAGGGAVTPRVIPVQARPYGASYGEWSARWWQWAYSLPVSENPFFDEVGERCDAGQSGPVWYLTGVINVSGTASRACTVPAGKAIFVPLLNFECDNLCPPIDPPLDAAGLRSLCDGFMDGATDVACEIDGISVKDLAGYRVLSPVFSVNFPDDNVFQFFGCDVPAGSYTPFVSDGFFVMLAPLSAGDHTVHFHGSLPDFGFTLDISYDLTVR